MDIDDKRLCIVDIHDVIVDTDYNIHAHQKGTAALHHSFSVLLFNTKNELMLKKLPLNNPLYPGYIDNSCHSHPYINKMSWDDPSQDCAMQASDHLKREFGIDVKADDLTLQDRLLYKSDDKTGNMGFLGRNFLIHDVDRNILEKDLGLVPKMFYASNFVDHEINYLFSYMGDFEIVPNLSEYSEVIFVDRKKLESIVERPECTPWLKAAQKSITLFNLNIEGSMIIV